MPGFDGPPGYPGLKGQKGDFGDAGNRVSLEFELMTNSQFILKFRAKKAKMEIWDKWGQREKRECQDNLGEL